jgi:hypothetical protein
VAAAAPSGSSATRAAAASAVRARTAPATRPGTQARAASTAPHGEAVPEYWGPYQVDLALRQLDEFWAGSSPTRGSRALIRASLAYLRPAAVVAVTSRDSPLGRFLSRLLGQPTYQFGQVLTWLSGGRTGHNLKSLTVGAATSPWVLLGLLLAVSGLSVVVPARPWCGLICWSGIPGTPSATVIALTENF